MISAEIRKWHKNIDFSILIRVSCYVFWEIFQKIFRNFDKLTPRASVAVIRPGYKNIQNLWSHVTRFLPGPFLAQLLYQKALGSRLFISP